MTKLYLHCLLACNCCSFIEYCNSWMDLRFDVLFNSILVISGQWLDDNESLCTMESRLRLEKWPAERGSNPRQLNM